MPLALASPWRAAIAGAGLLALAACETDRVTDAEPAAAPIIDRTDRVTSELARGQQALSSGDLSTAQAAFTAALRGSPNDPEPALGLAETYLALGDMQTAGRLFDLVASDTSGADEGRLLQGRGLAALGQGQTDEAIRLLERSVDRSPGMWRAWAGLGRAYGRQGRSGQARSAFARAEDAAPVRALVINDIGMLHLEDKDPAAALEAFQRALAVDPANETASANARIARAMLGEYDAAVSGARPGEMPDVLNNVGYIAIVNGDFEVADRLLRRAVEISPVYHEAASANLGLLAQAMKGMPVLALADEGVSAPQGAAGTEPSSVAGEAVEAVEADEPPADRAAMLELAARTASPLDPGSTARQDRRELDAIDIATAAQAPALVPPASSLALAHGFRWDAPPVSTTKKTRRKRRPPPAPAAGNPDGDPRTAAWPVIALPPEAAPDAPAAPAAPAASAPDPLDIVAASQAGAGSAADSPESPVQPEATPAAEADAQAVEKTANRAEAAPEAAVISNAAGLPR